MCQRLLPKFSKPSRNTTAICCCNIVRVKDCLCSVWIQDGKVFRFPFRRHVSSLQLFFRNKTTKIHCIFFMFYPSMSEHGVIGVLCSDQQGLALSGQPVYNFIKLVFIDLHLIKTYQQSVDKEEFVHLSVIMLTSYSRSVKLYSKL